MIVRHAGLRKQRVQAMRSRGGGLEPRERGHRGIELRDAVGNRGLLRLLRAARGGAGSGASAERTDGRGAERAADRAAERAVSSLAGVPVGPHAVQGPTSRLPVPVQAWLEAALGADLGGVRIHTGSDAARRAREQGARAYTLRDDIYFDEGRFAPGTREGLQLLAHEAAHVLQQRATGAGWIQRQPDPNAPIGASEIFPYKLGDKVLITRLLPTGIVPDDDPSFPPGAQVELTVTEVTADKFVALEPSGAKREFVLERVAGDEFELRGAGQQLRVTAKRTKQGFTLSFVTQTPVGTIPVTMALPGEGGKGKPRKAVASASAFGRTIELDVFELQKLEAEGAEAAKAGAEKRAAESLEGARWKPHFIGLGASALYSAGLAAPQPGVTLGFRYRHKPWLSDVVTFPFGIDVSAWRDDQRESLFAFASGGIAYSPRKWFQAGLTGGIGAGFVTPEETGAKQLGILGLGAGPAIGVQVGPVNLEASYLYLRNFVVDPEQDLSNVSLLRLLGLYRF